jgi:hypothetical protein
MAGPRLTSVANRNDQFGAKQLRDGAAPICGIGGLFLPAE